ncbi:MAG: endonuclease MutS2 [Chloroflexota bacterium]
MISERALAILEFDEIRRMLAEHASFSMGKEAALALEPATDIGIVGEQLRQTSEGRLLLAAHPSAHLGGARDVRNAVGRARVGAVLTPAEFLDIGGTLSASARLRHTLRSSDQPLPWFHHQAERLIDQKDLMDAIDRTFTDRGEILDSASGTLRRLRHEVVAAESRLTEKLRTMTASSSTRESLQEPIVTMRNGRYVLPVRAEARAKIPGIVHDQSSSGQTVFIEPLVVTELNNRLKELQLDEQREVERILRALSEQIVPIASELTDTVEALGAMDLVLAKARYAEDLGAVEPALNGEGRISLLEARHPLLGEGAVPISVWLGRTFRILVITGPNTGGKTVALKTVGLLTLMAQAGLHLPAGGGSEVAVFPRVYADIGDEQSIQQSLSTFSSHMRTIIDVLPLVRNDSLVLLDELGAGTDPAEGAALARAILTTLLERGARAVVTTHYSEIKSFAHESEGVENGSVEFDVETLSPTYRLTIGLPGRSQALAIARRLGMAKAVITLAQGFLAQGAAHIEDLLRQIQDERKEMSRLFERATEIHGDAGKLRARAREELSDVLRRRDAILAEAGEEAAGAIRGLRSRLQQIEREAPAGRSGVARRRLSDEIEAAREEATLVLNLAADRGAVVEPGGISAGSTVQVGSLGQQGTVLSVNDGVGEVQVGQFKLRVPVEDLELATRAEKQRDRAVETSLESTLPPAELDLRGRRAEEAIYEVDQYLHDSYLHGQSAVRIIHGKGTGALRQVIHEQLRDHPVVRSFATEAANRGGEGVTVVQLGQ